MSIMSGQTEKNSIPAKKAEQKRFIEHFFMVRPRGPLYTNSWITMKANPLAFWP